MNLAKYADGEYLKAGDHDVTIKEFKRFKYNSGSEGLEVHMADAAGRTTKTDFNLNDKCLWVLASFAQACGITREELADYSHDMLQGRHVRVRVVGEVKGDKTYHSVDKDNQGWWPVGTDTTPLREGPAATVQHPSTLPEVEDTRGADDIPF